MYLQSTSSGEIGLILHNILYDILGYKTNGTFIEVGANDGMVGSFTYNLSRIGWNGIYCEPIPHIYERCKNNHSFNANVKVLNIAVGSKIDKLEITDGDTLSTMDSETLEVYKKTDWSVNYFQNARTYLIDVEPLNDILSKNNITADFDLFVLDVEGYETEVLNGFNIDLYKPKIVIIEIADQHNDFVHNEIIMSKYANIRKHFKENNYSLLVNDIVDNIYVRNDLYNDKYKEIYSKMIQFNQKIV